MSVLRREFNMHGEMLIMCGIVVVSAQSQTAVALDPCERQGYDNQAPLLNSWATAIPPEAQEAWNISLFRSSSQFSSTAKQRSSMVTAVRLGAARAACRLRLANRVPDSLVFVLSVLRLVCQQVRILVAQEGWYAIPQRFDEDGVNFKVWLTLKQSTQWWPTCVQV